MKSDGDAEQWTALDHMLADTALMAPPASIYQEGPRLDSLYGGPHSLNKTSTSGACGIDGLGCGSLMGGATFASGGLGGPGVSESLGLVICGLPAISGAATAPPLAHRREVASMTRIRAREPVSEIRIDSGVGVAAPFPPEPGAKNLQGTLASTPAPKGRDENDSSSSSSETPPVAKTSDTKRQRVKAPTRGAYTRGSLKTISEIQESWPLGQAMEVYEGAKVAATSAGSHASRLKWWEAIALKHGHPTYPLTVPALKLAGSLLKGGGYRSAALYIAAFKREHVRQGHDWSAQLAQEMADGARAFKRGKGPDRQSGYIPLDFILAEPPVDDHWPQVAGGPSLPTFAYMAGCFWLLREIELSTAKLGAVTFQDGPGCGLAYWDLPVSKSDVEALGKVRVLECACPSLACPVKVLRKLTYEATRLAQGRDLEAPLCPTASGDFPTKAGVVKSYREMGDRYGRRGERLTGHATRVHGAVRMAEAGFEIWRIQIFGRWGSAAVLKYVRDAPVGVGAGIAQMCARSRDLEGIRKDATDLRREFQLSEAHLRTAVRCALEEINGQLGEQDKDLRTEFADLKTHILANAHKLSLDEGVPAEGWVLNRAGRKVLHAVRNTTHTYCGWAWRSSKAAALRSDTSSVDVLCASCLKCQAWSG